MKRFATKKQAQEFCDKMNATGVELHAGEYAADLRPSRAPRYSNRSTGGAWRVARYASYRHDSEVPFFLRGKAVGGNVFRTLLGDEA